MAHKHAVGTMSSNIFFAMATDKRKKSVMMLQMHMHKTENHHINCLRQVSNETKNKWEKTALYNATSAVPSHAR